MSLMPHCGVCAFCLKISGWIRCMTTASSDFYSCEFWNYIIFKIMMELGVCGTKQIGNTLVYVFTISSLLEWIL